LPRQSRVVQIKDKMNLMMLIMFLLLRSGNCADDSFELVIPSVRNPEPLTTHLISNECQSLSHRRPSVIGALAEKDQAAEWEKGQGFVAIRKPPILHGGKPLAGNLFRG
jgi:hypothetical protein